MKAADWIDRIKVKNGWSDYRVAKTLGFSANTISTYRKSGGPMDENIAIKVAHELEVNPAIVLADQAMERAKDGEARTAWNEILERLGGMAAACLIGVGISAAPAPAQATTSPLVDSLYIMLRNRRRGDLCI